MEPQAVRQITPISGLLGMLVFVSNIAIIVSIGAFILGGIPAVISSVIFLLSSNPKTKKTTKRIVIAYLLVLPVTIAFFTLRLIVLNISN